MIEEIRKPPSIACVLLLFAGITGIGIVWLFVNRLVPVNHSISRFQMAQQQEFFVMKFVLGLVAGVIVGWIAMWMAHKSDKIRKKVDPRTVFVVCILVLLTIIPLELISWGYQYPDQLITLRKWLPFNIAFGSGWFLGSGLSILYHFREVFRRSQPNL